MTQTAPPVPSDSSPPATGIKTLHPQIRHYLGEPRLALAFLKKVIKGQASEEPALDEEQMLLLGRAWSELSPASEAPLLRWLLERADPEQRWGLLLLCGRFRFLEKHREQEVWEILAELSLKLSSDSSKKVWADLMEIVKARSPQLKNEAGFQ